jgi:hypothetical protein
MAGRKMVYKGSNDGSSPIYRKVPANISQTFVKGSIVVKTTGKASAAADAATAGTVWGIAAEDFTTGGAVTAADVLLIDVNPNSIYEMPHNTTGTKTTLTNEDIGKTFDLINAYTADLDDTTGGFVECVGFSSERKTIFAQIKGRVQDV